MLRAESVSGQLEGTIPSTSEGQSADSSNLVNASGLNISAMGTMGGGFGRNHSDRTQENSRNDRTKNGKQGEKTDADKEDSEDSKEESNGNNFGNFDGDFNGNFSGSNFSGVFGGEGGFNIPEGGQWPDMGSMPGGGTGALHETTQEKTQGSNNKGSGSFGGNTNSSRPSFNGSMSGMPSFGTSGNTGSASATTIGLLAASVVVMLLGLLVAYKYKR